MIKLYHEEKGTDQLNDLIDSENPEIVISDLTKIEMISALAKKVRMDEIDKKIFDEAVLAFESDTTNFDIVEIDDAIKDRTLHLLRR